jgi:hypothetical protein
MNSDVKHLLSPDVERTSKNHVIVLVCGFVGALALPNIAIAVESAFVPHYILKNLVSVAARYVMPMMWNSFLGGVFGLLTGAAFVVMKSGRHLKFMGWICIGWNSLVLFDFFAAYLHAPDWVRTNFHPETEAEASWRVMDVYIQSAPHVLWAVILFFCGAKLLRMDWQGRKITDRN